MGRRRCTVTIGLIAVLASSSAAAQKAEIALPVLVPLTGSVAHEGISQRNGATLAARQIREVAIDTRVLDTRSSAETAVSAWERAVRRPLPPAVVGPVLAAQVRALMPLAQSTGVPLLTLAGATRLSDGGNPYFFRFFPSDATLDMAHARYVVEKLGARRPAVISQGTADGPSGRELARILAGLKAPPVEASVASDANDLSAALGRAKAAGADAIVLHLHAASAVAAVRQARQILPGLPIVAAAALHQPATMGMLEPAELQGVCAATAAAPNSATDGPLKEFAESYRRAFKSDPDAVAAAQYDAVGMLRAIAANLHRASATLSPIAVRSALARDSYKGLVTTYKSDGKGNMAHEAVIVCFDGKSRIAQVAERYEIR